MVLLLILLGVFCQTTFGSEIPVCKAATFFGTVWESDDSWTSGPEIYSYNFKMQISVDNKNVTYSNVITVTDFKDWSLNASIYYWKTPLWFRYGNTGAEYSVNCTNMNKTCVFAFPNGPITSRFIFRYNDHDSNYISEGPLLFINDGGIFNGLDFNMMDQNNPCLYGAYNHGHNIIFHSYVCCTEYDSILVPDALDDECTEMQSTTSLVDCEYGTNMIISANYDISQANNSTVFNIITNLVKAPSYGYQYTFGICTLLLFNGNTSSSEQSYEKRVENSLHNLQLDFMFQINSEITSNSFGRMSEEIILRKETLMKRIHRPFTAANPCSTKAHGAIISNYFGIMLGGVIMRNGKLIKNNYKPFTVNDPCLTKTQGVPFSSAIYNSTFCCTKFKKSVLTTTPKITLPSSTITVSTLTSTMQPVSDDPKSNAIGSPCSNDTSKAWLDIVFVIDTSKSMPKRELSQLAAEISTYMEDFTFGQDGNHTVRTAIIGYASDITTYYELTDTTNYDDFVDALFNFANRGSFDDEGGNVQGALQQAYDLLVSQKSQRRPLIILIAAAYNPTGFQGADVTASNIKQNGICIIVINFATSQGVLANTLQSISCDGYYYVSNDTDLLLKLPYALTQLNCFCPPGSLQFREPNASWNNYTNYADCMFGSSFATSPKLAEMSCRPGVLAAVTSQNKLDFITDHVVPYVMPKLKKFTIGLHVASDSVWKWWGYNQTEYPLGNYPSMSDMHSNEDNYGYMWNNYGFNWTLQTGKNVPLPYICQLRACDTEYICGQTQTKKFKND